VDAVTAVGAVATVGAVGAMAGESAPAAGVAPRPPMAASNITPVVAFLRADQLDMVGPR
jgi:hypothetical protein